MLVSGKRKLLIDNVNSLKSASYLDMVQHNMDNTFRDVRRVLPECPIRHLDKIPLSQCPIELYCRFPLFGSHALNRSKRKERNKSEWKYTLRKYSFLQLNEVKIL